MGLLATLTIPACSVTFFRGTKPVVISTTSSVDKLFTPSRGDIVEITWEVCLTETRFRLPATGIRVCKMKK